MTEQIDQFTDNTSIYEADDNQIFNGGLCYFRCEFAAVGIKEKTIQCICCGYSTVTDLHPLFVIRRCDEIKTRIEVLEENSVHLPNIVKLAGNLGIAVIRHILSGGKKSSRELILKRLEICERDTLYYNDGVCLHCGCNVNDKDAEEGLNKLAWEESKCPIGLW